VRSAARLYRLQLLLAAAALVLALAGAALLARAVSFTAPAPDALLEACGSFALPQVTASSVALLAVATVSFAVMALGFRSARRQLTAQRRLRRALVVAGEVDAGASRALVFEGRSPQAFCTGLARPRVYVSSGAVELLERRELRAVLAHEAHHARRRDPLRVFLARTLADALFFAPAVRRLAERYEALAELAADEAAVELTNDRSALAEALLMFDRAPSPAAVGIAPERVDHLLGQRPRWELPIAVVVATVVVLVGSAAVLLRLAEATSQATVNVPLLAAQACMLLMAFVPPAIGAIVLLGSRRMIRRRGG
jgi:Zn-dependent protease with chaperone function